MVKTKDHFLIINSDRSHKVDKWDIGKWRLILPFLKNNKKNQEILDIGCSDCLFFDFLKKHNIKFNGFGFDTDDFALKLAKKKGYYTYNNLYKIKKKFDIICLWEIIEHLTLDEFLKYLKIIKKLLKKDGLLIVSTPNIENIFYPFWAQPTHIRPYSMNSLVNLLKAEKFKTIYKKHTHSLKNPLKLLFCKLMRINKYNKIFVVAKIS